jgi:hypothetical protein
MGFVELDLAEARWFKERTENSGTPEELALRGVPGLYDHSLSHDPDAVAARARLAELGNAVYRVVPDRYEAYCKILHPIFELAHVKDREQTWDEWERSQPSHDPQGMTGDVERDQALSDVLRESTLWKGGATDSEEARRISWMELAHRYGVSYVAEISGHSFRGAFGVSWPRYLAGPSEGNLEDRELEALLGVLAVHTDGDVHVFFDLLKEGAATGRYEDQLYRGPIAEVRTLVDRLGLGSPSALWPEDRSWFVYTDWDLEFTVAGGPRNLINALAGAPDLECIEVRPETRVDYRADEVNLADD